MKKNLKKGITTMLGIKEEASISDFILFAPLNFFEDMKLFYKHTNVFKNDTFKKLECRIILDYHSIEKGFLFTNFKPRFAQQKIKNLRINLKNEIIINNVNLSQIKVGYQVMCKYYELHRKISIDISDYYTEEDYEFFKKTLSNLYTEDFRGIIEYSKDAFYELNNEKFEYFSYSRKSIRDFTGEKIDLSVIKDAIKLSANAPSVCNRQSSKVYLLENKKLIDEVLKIQDGFSGYSKNVGQLLILTTDRNLFYSIGERNQMFIDGGLFLMNLLYSLHYYKIANCPANWGKTIQEEKKLKQYINIPESEKIICLIPIGIAKENFRVTLSQRREIDELFRII